MAFEFPTVALNTSVGPFFFFFFFFVKHTMLLKFYMLFISFLWDAERYLRRLMPIFMELYKNAWCLNLNKIKIGSGEENWVFKKKM